MCDHSGRPRPVTGVSAVPGLHDAADHAPGEGPRQVPGLLHPDPGNDVGGTGMSGGRGVCISDPYQEMFK